MAFVPSGFLVSSSTFEVDELLKSSGFVLVIIISSFTLCVNELLKSSGLVYGIIIVGVYRSIQR